jgi:surfactin synthase thioesterase subunit
VYGPALAVGANLAGPLIVASLDNPGSSSIDPWQIIGYGVGPITVVALMLAGQLVPKKQHDAVATNLAAARDDLQKEREQHRNDIQRKDDQLLTLQANTSEPAIKALTQNTLMMERLMPMIQADALLQASARTQPRRHGGETP